MINNWVALNLITTGTLFGLGGGSCSKLCLSNPKFKVGDCTKSNEQIDEFNTGFKSKILKIGKKQYLTEIAIIGTKSNGAKVTEIISYFDESYILTDCEEFK